MPIIPPIQPGQHLTQQAPQKHDRALKRKLAESVSAEKKGSERRFRQERRLSRIKISLDRRHRGNRRAHRATDKPNENTDTIGVRIDTQA